MHQSYTNRHANRDSIRANRAVRVSIPANARTEDDLRKLAAKLVAMHRDGQITETMCRENIARGVVQFIENYPKLRGSRNEDLRNAAIRYAVSYATKTYQRPTDVGKDLKSFLDLDRVDKICQWVVAIISTAHNFVDIERLTGGGSFNGCSLDEVVGVEDSGTTRGDMLPSDDLSIEEQGMRRADEVEMRRLDLAVSIESHPSSVATKVVALVEFLDLPDVAQFGGSAQKRSRKLARVAGSYFHALRKTSDVDSLRHLLPFWTELDDEMLAEAIGKLAGLGEDRCNEACRLLTALPG